MPRRWLAATTQAGDLGVHAAVGAEAGPRPNSYLHRLPVPVIAGAGLAAVLALLLWLLGDHDQRAHPQTVAQPLAAAVTATRAPGGVGMPETMPGDVPVKPLRLVVVLDRTYPPMAERGELRALGSWLQIHANPATRVTVINMPSLTMTPALPGAALSAAQRRRHERRLGTAIRAAFRAGRGRPLLVILGLRDVPRLRGLTTLRVMPRDGATLPINIQLRPGETANAFIDPWQTQTFAATTARAVIVVSQMRERR